MGLLSAASSILGVAGNVTSTVMSMGSTALQLGGKFVKSFPGKLAIGAVVGSILASKVTGGENIFSKIGSKHSEGFKSFFSSAKQSVATAALNGVASVTKAGEEISASDLAASRNTLQNMISTDADRGTPVAQAAPVAMYEQEPEPDQNTYTAAEPAYGG